MPVTFRNLFQEDIDIVFSFKTIIEVRILDRNAGIPLRFMQLFVVIYFFYSVN